MAGIFFWFFGLSSLLFLSSLFLTLTLSSRYMDTALLMVYLSQQLRVHCLTWAKLHYQVHLQLKQNESSCDDVFDFSNSNVVKLYA